MLRDRFHDRFLENRKPEEINPHAKINPSGLGDVMIQNLKENPPAPGTRRAFCRFCGKPIRDLAGSELGSPLPPEKLFWFPEFRVGRTLVYLPAPPLLTPLYCDTCDMELQVGQYCLDSIVCLPSIEPFIEEEEELKKRGLISPSFLDCLERQDYILSAIDEAEATRKDQGLTPLDPKTRFLWLTSAMRVAE